MSDKAEKVVHVTAGAGRWFPGDTVTLKAMVGDYIDSAAVPEATGRIVGAIAPHAGFIYSGRVAGCTFRALKDNAEKFGAPETVVILGFSHRRGFGGMALMDGDAIRSPIGETAFDLDAGKMLAESSDRIFLNSELHTGEHSAENEVPFAQMALPSSKLVIGLIGDHDLATLKDVVDGLVALSRKKKIVVVASTDLLHHADYALVTKTDKETLKTIASMDADGLMKSWSYSNQVCCGIGPVSAVMKFAQALGCSEGEILHYRNSGDDFPESRGSWVVGYGSVIFSVTEKR